MRRKVKRRHLRYNPVTGKWIDLLKKKPRAKKVKNPDAPDIPSGPRCPCCGRRGVATVERPMVLRRCFGLVSPVKVCPHCDKRVTDLEIVFDCLPMKRWRKAKKVIYGGVLITKENMNFTQPIGLWEIPGRRIRWSVFKGGLRRFRGRTQGTISHEADMEFKKKRISS